jgi:hypothetical protein
MPTIQVRHGEILEIVRPARRDTHSTLYTSGMYTVGRVKFGPKRALK